MLRIVSGHFSEGQVIYSKAVFVSTLFFTLNML